MDPSEGATYPQTRLWSQDYTQVLWDSQKDEGTAEEWFAASDHDDWLGMSIDHGPGGWRTRWGGRLTKHEDGSIQAHPTSEFLKHLVMPNPLLR